MHDGTKYVYFDCIKKKEHDAFKIRYLHKVTLLEPGWVHGFINCGVTPSSMHSQKANIALLVIEGINFFCKDN